MKKIFEWIKLLVLLFIFLNAGFIVANILIAFSIDVRELALIDFIYIEVILQCVIFIMIFLAYKDTFFDDWHIFKEKLHPNLKKCFQFFILIFVVKFGAAIVQTMISLILNIDVGQAQNQSVIDSFTGVAPLLMLISTVILAPIYEEGLFRAGFGKVIRGRYTFIIISGLIFGLIHIFPTELALSVALTQSITYVAMGFTLSWIYTETKNIYHVTVVHAANNLVSLIVILLLL
jgi:membrane protease YdiL (CAAX protease family)